MVLYSTSGFWSVLQLLQQALAKYFSVEQQAHWLLIQRVPISCSRCDDIIISDWARPIRLRHLGSMTELLICFKRARKCCMALKWKWSSHFSLHYLVKWFPLWLKKYITNMINVTHKCAPKAITKQPRFFKMVTLIMFVIYFFIKMEVIFPNNLNLTASFPL